MHTPGVPDITDDTFAAEVLAADRPVLVKFTADWCPGCRQLGPVLGAIAAERADRLKIVQLDADHHPATTAAHGVLSLPTLILFDAGQPVLRLVGSRSRQRLLREIDAAWEAHREGGGAQKPPSMLTKRE